MNSFNLQALADILKEEKVIMKYRHHVKVFSSEHGVFEGIYLPEHSTDLILGISVGRMILKMPWELVKKAIFLPEEITASEPEVEKLLTQLQIFS